MSATESRSKFKLTLDEHGDRVGLLDILDESVLFLSKRVLVDSSSPTKDIGCQVIDRVLGDTSNTQLQPAVSYTSLELLTFPCFFSLLA
jgi:hypothetical protein